MPDPSAIRAAITACFDASPAPPTVEDLAAAVIRAAADQVVPADQSTNRPSGLLRTGDMLWDDETAATCRRRLLAIAAELEATQ